MTSYDSSMTCSEYSVFRGSAGDPKVNTLNRIEICYLDHVGIDEVWPEDADDSGRAKPGPGDPAAIEDSINNLEDQIDSLADQRTQATLSGASVSSSEDYYKQLADLQSQIQELQNQRAAAESAIAPELPPRKERVFLIASHIPANLKQIAAQAKSETEPLKKELEKALDDWKSAHDEHEDTKKQLNGLSDQKRDLEVDRELARENYELAKREALKSAGSHGFLSGIQQWMDQHSEDSARKDCQNANKAVDDFKSGKYNKLKKKERSEYKKLVALMEKNRSIADRLNAVELKYQEAINTLEDGSTIQMVAFPDARDRKSTKSADDVSTKSPVVGVKVDAPVDFLHSGVYCNRLGPDGKKKHPSITVTDSKGATEESHDPRGGQLTIYEKQRALLDVGDTWNAFQDLARVAFSFNPAINNYTVAGSTCGAFPNNPKDVPKELKGFLEVYPADSFAIKVSTKPAGKMEGSKSSTLELEGTKPVDWKPKTESESSGKVQWSFGGADKSKTAQPGEPPGLDERFVPDVGDIVLLRNGIEDPVTKPLRETLKLITEVTREAPKIFTNLQHIVPSVGWKFDWSLDFLAGNVMYQHEWKEHTDWHVWHHHKLEIDMEVMSGSATVGLGIWIDALKSDAGIDACLTGSIGIQASFESTHPCASKRLEISVGLLGEIGLKLEAKVVVGDGSLLNLGASAETAIKGTGEHWFMKEGRAPYYDGTITFEGITLKASAHIALLGQWGTGMELVKEMELWKGEWPAKFDEKDGLKESNKRIGDMKEKARQDNLATEQRRADVLMGMGAEAGL
jgi:hypothetical protein